MSVRIDPSVQALSRRMIALRHDLHAHPELSWQEVRTAQVVAERLRQAGLEVREGVPKTGVVALLRGAQPGKTLLVRADMDALPITEENDVPCRSQNPGVMHA